MREDSLSQFGAIDVGAFCGAVDVQMPPMVARRFESAETTRLNEAHWEPVSTNLKQSLIDDMPTVRERCRHEAVNNSVIDAGLETHATNVVGANGPALQILTDNDGFNDLVEALFKSWSDECEYQDNLSLTDLLTGWVGQWAFGGALLAQEIVGKSVNEYRIHDLGAESLDWTKVGKNFFGGVEVDDNQQVIAYHVYDPNNPMVKDVLKKEYTLHAYRRKFAMQRIGIPSLSSSLPTAADLRDYDDQVMDAARAAADYSIIMVTDHPDSQFSTPAQTTVPVRRRTRQYATPGWKPMELKGNQPTINYGEYRKQRHADVGGTIGEMPLMIFRRNAADHTMSSSRVDTARYAKAIERWQKHIERRVLNHIVRRLVRLAQLQRLLPPTPLNKITKKLQYDFPNCVLPISWTWTKQPPIDPLKDAMAQRMRLENGTYSFSQAVAEDGNRPDEVIRLRARDNAALEKAGLPVISGALPMDPVVMQAILAADASEDQPSKPETTDSLEPTSPSE